MAATSAPRFKSGEVALRLYFRAGELLAPDAKPGGFFNKRRPTFARGPNLISDLYDLDSCLAGLSDVQLWMLRELYGPGCFTIRKVRFTDLCQRVRRRFPERGWGTIEIAQLKREALKLFEARLMRMRLM